MAQQPAGGAYSVAYQVNGQRLLGIWYRPPGVGPHPAAVLLHGIPGSEKNYDIAYALRETGWHALIVLLRGSWGSGGAYSMAGQVDDAVWALDWLLRPGNPHLVEPSRVVLVGYSLGSRAALMAGTRDERVSAVVSISGFADFKEVSLGADFLEECALVLSGVTARRLSRQWMSLGKGDQPVDAVARLDRPLLIVHGEADEVVAFENAPRLKKAADDRATLISIAGADHVFSAHRAQMVDAVVGWLVHTLPG